MITGPYSICFMEVSGGGSDSVVYRTLKYGYTNASQAFSDLPRVAVETGCAVQDCAVIRHIEAEESEDFAH